MVDLQQLSRGQCFPLNGLCILLRVLQVSVAEAECEKPELKNLFLFFRRRVCLLLVRFPRAVSPRVYMYPVSATNKGIYEKALDMAPKLPHGAYWGGCGRGETPPKW